MTITQKRYESLKLRHFQEIAKKTGYSTDYVRQVLRGYITIHARHAKILNEADHLLNNHAYSLLNLLK